MVLKNSWRIDDLRRKKKDLWILITERMCSPQRVSRDQRMLLRNPPQGYPAINNKQDLGTGLISLAERSSTPF